MNLPFLHKAKPLQTIFLTCITCIFSNSGYSGYYHCKQKHSDPQYLTDQPLEDHMSIHHSKVHHEVLGFSPIIFANQHDVVHTVQIQLGKYGNEEQRMVAPDNLLEVSIIYGCLFSPQRTNPTLEGPYESFCQGLLDVIIYDYLG